MRFLALPPLSSRYHLHRSFLAQPPLPHDAIFAAASTRRRLLLALPHAVAFSSHCGIAAFYSRYSLLLSLLIIFLSEENIL